MVNLVLVLGDQLSPDLSALKSADKTTDIVVMAEVMGEARYVPHHPKKIALIFASMRKFARELRQNGWTVDYITLDAPENSGSLVGELDRAMARHGAERAITTEAGEWRVRDDLLTCPYVSILPDDRFMSCDWSPENSEIILVI